MDIELTPKRATQRYRDLLESSRLMYLFNLDFLTEVCKGSVKDLAQKKKKYLPSEGDRKFRDKLYKNDLTQAVVTSNDFQKELEAHKLKSKLDADLADRIYKHYRKKDEYTEYSQNPSVEAHHMVILLDLYKFITKDEDFVELMDDQFSIWEDDKSLVIGAIKKTIKSLPEDFESYRTYRPDREAAVDFGEVLLEKVLQDSAQLEDVIGPTLENWDIERVAVIDRLLIQMAIVEFMEFQSIPTKVTINEYVEIAKLYSTDKSKDFINGVLDKLRDKLDQEGKITKAGRGLVDS